MRKFKRRSRHALSFRLFFVLAGALFLLAAFAPTANAQGVLIYFNFEDTTLGGAYDPNSDQQPAFGGDNPGGGVQASLLTDNFVGAGTGAVAGTLVNRTAGDSDIANPGLAIGLRTTPLDNGHWIQFHANTTAFSNMSLSFAINTQGNGFDTVTASYSTNGGTTFTNFGSTFVPAGGGFHAFTFAVPVGAEGQPDVIFRLTFTGGTSNGNNLQTIIDNIQLTGVPEPTTVVGGLLGVLGLCWHQRRRLIRSVRFRRA
jgi:hypothetical protein